MRYQGLSAAAIVLVLLASSFLIVPDTARGVLTGIELVPGKYAGNKTYDNGTVNVYAPGEIIVIILYGDEGDEYSIFIGSGWWTGLDLFRISPVVVGPGGTAKVSIPYTDNQNDGIYRIDVADVDTQVFDISTVFPDGHANFEIQGYRFVMETDRPAYLGGDFVNIFWTANNIKDESLAANGVGKLVIFNGTGSKLSEYAFSEAAGSYTYPLNQQADTSGDYTVIGWFNDTIANPKRKQTDVRTFDVSDLALVISLDSEVYAPGSLVVVEVKTLATETVQTPSLADPAEPGCKVEMMVYLRSGGSWLAMPSYDAEMTSDANGYARYVFQLSLGLADGVEFKVAINASKNSRMQSDDITFKISSTAGLSIVISLDKTQYTSGDTVRIGATVSSIGSTGSPVYTYVYEVRGAEASGTLLARATTSVPGYNFSIADDFEGILWISVTADDGRGNKATVFKLIDVKFAVVMVNADADMYTSGDTIIVHYSVYGEMSAPTMFYEVLDADGASVSEGNATGGSFSFAVPAAPSSSDTFRVIASQGGRLVFGEDTVEQVAGYVVLMEFNRNVYEPGDTITVKYHIVALGGTPMPGTFRITYGLSNGPTLSTQTAEIEGTLHYVVPETIDEGDQIFWMYTGGGGTSTEVNTVLDNPTPLWYTRIGGLPLFEVLLFLLVVVCLALIARNSKHIKRGLLASEEPDVNIPPKAKASKPRRQQSSSPAYSVPCNSCGSAIEISTSRRPIEVMCPSCGETQIVEK